MKYLPYVFKHLRRNWIRSMSTVAAIAVCIFLFCTLQTFLVAVESSLEGSSARRLVARHRVSLAQVLPLSSSPPFLCSGSLLHIFEYTPNPSLRAGSSERPSGCLEWDWSFLRRWRAPVLLRYAEALQ